MTLSSFFQAFPFSLSEERCLTRNSLNVKDLRESILNRDYYDKKNHDQKKVNINIIQYQYIVYIVSI